MKANLRHSLLSLLALAAVATTATSVRAQTVSPNPAPTIITTAPYTISTSGYYQLGKDLIVSATSGNIITIAASNVTLDFAGHYISGPNMANTLAGVYAYEEGNLTIQNGTIAFCVSGIYLSGNGSAASLNINQVVRNMLVSYCAGIGIDLDNANYSSVSDCRVSFITSALSTVIGIDASDGGKSNEIVNNEVTNVSSTFASTSSQTQAYGIYGNPTGALIANNTVSNVSVPASGTAAGSTSYGIAGGDFAVNNKIYTAAVGISAATKYQNNLTANVATPFSGGKGVGYND